MRAMSKLGTDGLGIVWASAGLAFSIVRHDVAMISVRISV